MLRTMGILMGLMLGTAQAAEIPADALAPMALNSFSAPPANLAAAPVMNQSGEVIGTFRQVVTDHNGKPAAISYVTPDGKLVVVAAPAVSYDGRQLVTADSPQLLARR